MHDRVVSTGQELWQQIKEIKARDERPVGIGKGILSELERIVSRADHKCRNAYGKRRRCAYSQKRSYKMSLFSKRIYQCSVAVLEIGKEEEEENVPAKHIADIIMAHHHNC